MEKEKKSKDADPVDEDFTKIVGALLKVPAKKKKPAKKKRAN